MQLRSLLAKFECVVSWLQSPLLLVIRLYWGWQFFLTGKAKLMDIPTFVERFTNWGVPMPKINVVMAGTTEAVGGLLLALGLFARPAAVPLIGTMVVAYLTAEKESLHAIFSEPDKFVTADPFLFLFASVIVLVFGPGKLSLDALFFRKSGSA